MSVMIKEFGIDMEVKNKGIELEIRDAQENFLGDVIITKANIIWCKGKITRQKGIKISWEDFANMMENA